MKTEEKIKEMLGDCKKAEQQMRKAGNFNNAFVYQGWTEALECVLKGEDENIIPINEKEQSALNCIADCYLRRSGFGKQSGGYSYAEVIDRYEDLEHESFETKDEPKPSKTILAVELTFGVKDGCRDESYKEIIGVDVEILKAFVKDPKDKIYPDFIENPDY